MSERDSQAKEPILELRDVSTHYGLVSVLRDVNVRIFPGEIVCLLGGNASGKTTTLKTILGYVVPSKGEVRLAGETISGLTTTRIVGRGLSMVPENRRLFANMTVGISVAVTRRNHRRPAEQPQLSAVRMAAQYQRNPFRHTHHDIGFMG